MDRLMFLKHARQLACQQVVNVATLTEEEFVDIQSEIQSEAMNEEEAISQKARVILEDASLEMAD